MELQEDVAVYAKENIKKWSLADRVEIRSGDIRKLSPDASYDLVTLHNNIYYFPVETRLDLLKHISGFLKPKGSLLITTGCQGGSVVIDILNLWSSATDGCGRLPSQSEMVRELESAGFGEITSNSLIPGEAFYGFIGIKNQSSTSNSSMRLSSLTL